MKKNSFRQNSPGLGLKAVTLVAAAAIAIDMFSGGILRAQVKRAGFSIQHLSASALSGLSASGLFSTRSTLAHENAQLEARITQLEEQRARDSALRDENTALTQLVHLAEAQKGITAPVASSFRSSPYGTLLLGAGREEGIGDDALVLSPEGFLLGTVSDLSSHVATVSLLFAPGQKIDVLIGAVAGVAEGQGGGDAVITLPREEKVEEGAIVRMSRYAKNIAVVGHIDADPASATMRVYVRTPANLTALRYVYVVNI